MNSVICLIFLQPLEACALKQSKMDSYAATLSSIQKAREVIAPYAVVTPVGLISRELDVRRGDLPCSPDLWPHQVLTNSDLDKSSGFKLFFKCESFQRGWGWRDCWLCSSLYLHVTWWFLQGSWTQMWSLCFIDLDRQSTLQDHVFCSGSLSQCESLILAHLEGGHSSLEEHAIRSFLLETMRQKREL